MRVILVAVVVALVSSGLSGGAMHLRDVTVTGLVEDRREECMGRVSLDFQAIEEMARDMVRDMARRQTRRGKG